MALDLEALLIALPFLLPGFLTSRLVEARTPAVSRKPSPLEVTLDSLLRSVVIHLVIAVAVFLVFLIISPEVDEHLLQKIGTDGLSAYRSDRPLEAAICLTSWLVGAFVIAFVFGSVWDPVTWAMQHLAARTGMLSEDLLYFLRSSVAETREKGNERCQLWVQARLKNGYTYRGELMIAGYRDDNKSRELLLANVKFFPYPAQVPDSPSCDPKLYEYAVLFLSTEKGTIC